MKNHCCQTTVLGDVIEFLCSPEGKELLRTDKKELVRALIAHIRSKQEVIR